MAGLVDGELIGGEQDLRIFGVSGIKEAEEGDITFLANSVYLPFLFDTKASAVLVSREIVCENKPVILTDNPSRAFNKIVAFFAPSAPNLPVGIHSTAVIEKNVHLGLGISIGPHVFIGEGSHIGDQSVIQANSFIGPYTRIGKEVLIYPNVTIREYTEIGDRAIIHSGTVIGSDGYGYETIEDEHVKIPHSGTVLIEEDVEIGANVCVDRGRFKKTIIGRGSKIDNLVQIAHNVVIGPNCLIISQAGISGSTELGKNVIIAGQAGVVGHITIGDHAIIGAGAGVSKPVAAKAIVLGSPAKPIGEQKRLFAFIARLPDLFKDVAELKKKLK